MALAVAALALSVLRLDGLLLFFEGLFFLFFVFVITSLTFLAWLNFSLAIWAARFAAARVFSAAFAILIWVVRYLPPLYRDWIFKAGLVYLRFTFMFSVTNLYSCCVTNLLRFVGCLKRGTLLFLLLLR